MKVSELIECLNQCDMDATVAVRDNEMHTACPPILTAKSKDGRMSTVFIESDWEEPSTWV